MHERCRVGRRDFLTGALGLVATAWSGRASAEEPDMPVRLSVELLAKVVLYDRGFRRRAGSQALTAVLIRRGDPDSERTADQLAGELSRLATLGGLPHRVVKYEFVAAVSLAARVRTERPAVLYITPGLANQVADLGRALTSVDLLSVSAVARYVSSGVVLGFGVKSGRPRLVINLSQARKQHVDFSGDLLRVADVIP